MEFAITLRKSSGVRSYTQAMKLIKDYKYYIDKNISPYVLDGECNFCVCYEVKRIGNSDNLNLHCHMYIKTDRDFYTKPLQKRKGWHIYCETVRNMFLYTKYIHKEECSESAVMKQVSELCNTSYIKRYDTDLVFRSDKLHELDSDDDPDNPPCEIPQYKLFDKI